MPARDIASANEIWLGDTYFKLRGPVRLTNITVTQNPVVFGDTSKVTDTQFMSQFIQSHSLGGSGIYRGSVRTDFDRHWKSRADTRFRYTTLPPKVTDWGRPSGASTTTSDAHVIANLGTTFYVAFGSEVFSYDLNSSTWSALLRTLGATATDWATFSVSGVTYLVFAYGSGYDYMNATSGVWASDTDDAKYLCVFDDKLWTLRSTGALYYSTNLTSWTLSASFLRETTPSGLFVYRDASGVQRLYATTTNGLYILDQTNAKWLQTDVRYPPYATAGKNPLVFRDAKAYVATGGVSMISVEVGSTTVITPMGLDRDDGIESTETGEIVAVDADYNWIWALIDATAATGVDAYTSGMPLGPGGPVGSEGWTAATGTNTLRCWNGGWHCLWESGSSNYPAVSLRVDVGVDGDLRIVWGANRRVYSIKVPYGIYNPRQNPNWEYTDQVVSHITPWWDLSSEMQEKNVAHVPVFVSGASSTEKITVYYATDLSESWTNLGDITSDGLTILKIASGAGAKARLWRFRFDLQRGSDDNAAPLMDFYAAEFMKLLPATYGYVLEIDTSDQYRGKTPDQQLEAIKRLSDPAQTTSLIEFAFQDDLSGTTRTHYARVTRFQAAEYSGRKERGKGTVMMSVVVPYSSDSL